MRKTEKLFRESYSNSKHINLVVKRRKENLLLQEVKHYSLMQALKTLQSGNRRKDYLTPKGSIPLLSVRLGGNMEFWCFLKNTMSFILTILKFKLILIGLLLLLTQKQKLKVTDLWISTCHLREKKYIAYRKIGITSI